MTDQSITDLDALIPKGATIKIAGKEIEVKAPKMSDLLEISREANQLKEIDNLTAEQYTELEGKLTAIIKRMIPELAEVELQFVQLTKIIEIVADLATPADTKLLKEKGVVPNNPNQPA